MLASCVSSCYVILCTACHLVYVGSTVQAPWERYKQHLAAARRYRHFYNHRVSWRYHMNLTHHLCRHGLEHSIFVIIHRIPGRHEDYIRRYEWRAMTQFNRSRLLNDRVPHSGRILLSAETLTVCRQGIRYILSKESYAPLLRDMNRYGIKELVNRLVTLRHINYDSRTLLLLHQHLDKFFPPRSGSIVYFRHCMLKRLATMGIHLPHTLTISALQLSTRECAQLLCVAKQYIRALPMSSLLKQYYIQILRVVRKKASSLGDQLFNFRHALSRLSMDTITTLLNRPASECPCQLLGSHLPRVRQHVCFRPSDLSHHDIALGTSVLTTSMIIALQQDVRSTPTLCVSDRWPSLKQSLTFFTSQLKHGGQHPFDLHHSAYQILTDTHVSILGSTMLHNARSALGKLKSCLCGPLDKNPAGMWLCCRSLYYFLLHRDYLTPGGLGNFEFFATPLAAPRLMLANLRHYQFTDECRQMALKSLLHDHFDVIPSLYLILKNKVFPIVNDVIKTRPITSHFHHPFRRMAKYYTRGLAVLLKAAVKFLGPSVTVMCPNMMDSVKFWNLAINRFTSADIPFLRLFEYDLDSMYYYIPQQECVDAVRSFLQMFKHVFRRKQVAICRENRALDRIGSGSAEIFTNIPLTRLLQFCEYEVLGNSIARIGFIVYRQRCGIPMGGFPSAHLANIYLLMKEIQGSALHVSRHFFYFRYLDNLPGIMDLRVTTLQQIRQCFLDLYQIPLKLEQEGLVLNTLELRVTLCSGCIAYSHRSLLSDCMSPPLPVVDSSIQRVPPRWCARYHAFLHYYLPGAILKCIRYSSNLCSMLISFRNLISGLILHGYSLTTLLTFLLQYYRRKNFPGQLFHYVCGYLQLHLDLYPS